MNTPSRYWLRFGLFALLTAVIVVDFYHCTTNPKLAASGEFYGHLLFVGFLLIFGIILWMIARRVDRKMNGEFLKPTQPEFRTRR